MSVLLNSPSPVEGAPVNTHPWDKTIKHEYFKEKNYAHNSINNPHYPELKKNKKPNEDSVKFTVIGDRVTKEFIYCANLVSGLHKYKWRKFKLPELRGVSSVEWPEVSRTLKAKYGGRAYCIQSRVAVIMNDNFIGGETELKNLIESKYIYHLQLDYCNEAINNFATYIRSSGRPCAYMHISINDEPIGTLIFMLFSDLLPYTCDNFLRLCNERKGGYSGTPIHRIVKDGWIQGGGFGLKSTDLGCENFMVPHDRRGVLCMANDGRHVDCSTQFFVLLQPAPWMAQKYVAFGQLIEGEQTLNKIEEQPTWYESPTTDIKIYKAGILNLECDDIAVNKGTNEYIHGHIEDLYALGELLMESLIQRVFLESELRLVERLRKEVTVEEEEEIVEKVEGDLHRTRRFLRKRATHEGEKLMKESQAIRSQSIKSATTPLNSDHENNDFDVEEYEFEESVYQNMSVATESIVVKPEKPYYIPLTDVTYPGEKDSTYDLKKFLTGEYCLESDIDPKAPKEPKTKRTKYPSETIKATYDESESSSFQSLNSEEEKEIQEYLRQNAENVSYAGGIIKNISRRINKSTLFDITAESEQITEEQLRRVRLASADYKAAAQQQGHDTKVTLEIPQEHSQHRKIRRRHTGYVEPNNLIDKTESELALEEEDEDRSRKVRISVSSTVPPPEHRPASYRRPTGIPTGFIQMTEIVDSESQMDLNEIEERRESQRPSAIERLYEEARVGYAPTLKNYKNQKGASKKPTLLTYSPHYMKSEESEIQKLVLRKPRSTTNQLYDHAMEIQHNKKLIRKISSDYVKSFSQGYNKFDNSIRSIEYAKKRPAMTVSAYQMKNQKYQAEMKSQAQNNASKIIVESPPGASMKGLRLPDDSPLNSLILPPSLPSSMQSFATNNIEE